MFCSYDGKCANPIHPIAKALFITMVINLPNWCINFPYILSFPTLQGSKDVPHLVQVKSDLIDLKCNF